MDVVANLHDLAGDRRQDLARLLDQADPGEWIEKYQGRTKSIDGLPTRATDRFITGDA